MPRVFAAERSSAPIRASQVWLAELTFERGRFYSVNASSGMGKTSLCSFIYGLRDDYEGTIELDGADVSRMTVGERCRLRSRHLAYLPQDLDLFPQLSAVDNILLKNSLTDYRSEAEIRRMLGRLGLEERADSLVAHLSVGQRQRVALVRALCQPFDFILLDEPVSHLDAANNRLCAEMVTEAARSLGAGVIATSVGNPLVLPAESLTEIKL